jgi:hypothetical protein
VAVSLRLVRHRLLLSLVVVAAGRLACLLALGWSILVLS